MSVFTSARRLRVGEGQRHSRPEPRAKIEIGERAGDGRRLEELGARRAAGGRRDAEELLAFGGLADRPRDDCELRRTVPEPASSAGGRILESRIFDLNRRPGAGGVSHGKFDGFELRGRGAAAHRPERDARRIIGDGALDFVLAPVGAANRPVAHVVEKTHLLIGAIDAQPEGGAIGVVGLGHVGADLAPQSNRLTSY